MDNPEEVRVAAICRHSKDDPSCSSYRSPQDRYSDLGDQLEELRAKYQLGESPDSERFQIEDIEEMGGYLVVKVSYPNCRSCAYEGHKVLVFEGVTLKDAIKWRKIDPHFRKPGMTKKTEAPSPIARFPASEQGWKDALCWAADKSTAKSQGGKR